MKFFVLFLTLLMLCSPVSFAADTGVVRGQVGDSKKLPIYTDEELEEALAVSDECSGDDYWSLHYDCSCVGLNFLELRRRRGAEADSLTLKAEAQRKCPNAPAMAGKVYNECMHWAPAQRGDDYEEFCECYGSTYGRIYKRNPVSGNLLVSELQMTEAMSKCNVNEVNVKAQERAAFIKKLKENGSYEKLFPSAESNPQ